MSYVPKTINEVISEYLNRTTFLPAIQRGFVWDTDAIEKLFDSIMGDFPISTFLFWKIAQVNKHQWAAYEFIRDYDSESPRNRAANVNGINHGIYMVLDGQQRLTALFIGLKGSYRYFHYRWHKTKLYLNILKESLTPENPEELTYQFQFRESDSLNPKDTSPQLWYLVGDILNYGDAEDAKESIKSRLAVFSEEEKTVANKHIGRLFDRINGHLTLNYYEEKSQDYDKVVEAFIRANTGGVKLEYSDILLSTAAANWSKNARDEVHSFAESLNRLGSGYSFSKDFVLKGCLYLTDGLPIQYKVKNFTKNNLEKIEMNLEGVKCNIKMAVDLVTKFGFCDKNLVSKMALLPIAYYLSKRKSKTFVDSTDSLDVKNQIIIQKWLIITLLKNSFGGSSDTTLKGLQDVIDLQTDYSCFPYLALNKKLNIEPSFSESEIENLLSTNYSTKYSYLILSLLYQDRDWKGKKYHEDHLFPKSEFTTAKLKTLGYDQASMKQLQTSFNTVSNLQLLTASENLEKSSKPFAPWLDSRDANFKERHAIPRLSSYQFDSFLDFLNARKELLAGKLRALTFD